MRLFSQALVFLPLISFSSIAFSQSTLSFELSQNGTKLGLDGVANAVQADFNKDGKPDLITQDRSVYGDKQAKFSLRLGNGDGTFQAPIQVGAIPFDTVPTILVFDANRDGNPDLVLVSLNEISVQFGTGTGSFGQPILTAISGANTYGYPSYVTGDFNGDGLTDIAGEDGYGHVEVYQDNGAGKFTAAKTIAASLPGGNIDSLAAGDVDGDGNTDLVVSESTSSTTSINVLWGLGNNNFRDAAVKTYTQPQLAVVEKIGDLNQDGSPDILVEYSCKTTYYPAGHASPQSCTSIDAFYGGQGPQSVFFRHLVDDLSIDAAFTLQPVDVDGDGIADLVGEAETDHSGRQGLAFWLGQPDGSFVQTAREFSVTSDGIGTLVTGDFNRDGTTDFLLAGDNGGNPNLSTVALFLNATDPAACATSRISPTVVACGPVENTYIDPLVTLQAIAYDTTQITALQLYIDGNLSNNSEIHFRSPYAYLYNVSADLHQLGPHLLVTKAWDAHGVSFRTTRHVTVYYELPGVVCEAAPNSASICFPSGTTAMSPVRILANGATSAIPTAVQLYVDGTLAVNDTTHSTVLDIDQTLSSGSHQLVFKLYDADGGVFTATKNITVQ